MPQSESSGYVPSSAANAYQPPASGNAYEPPSYAPEAHVNPTPEETGDPATQDEQPKKKAFMDDDDDEDLAKRTAAIQKAENDRKADEAFRKAAEEDGKLATSCSLRSTFTCSYIAQLKKTPSNLRRRAGLVGGLEVARRTLITQAAVPSEPSSARRIRSIMTRI